jgi:hypothetical protein
VSNQRRLAQDASEPTVLPMMSDSAHGLSSSGDPGSGDGTRPEAQGARPLTSPTVRRAESRLAGEEDEGSLGRTERILRMQSKRTGASGGGGGGAL